MPEIASRMSSLVRVAIVVYSSSWGSGRARARLWRQRGRRRGPQGGSARAPVRFRWWGSRRGTPHRASPLVDEGLQAVGEVPRQGLQQAGQLHQRRLEGSGQLGQQHVAGRQVGQGLDVLGRDDLVAEQAALQYEGLVALGVVPQGLGDGGRVTLDEGDGRRSGEHRVQPVLGDLASSEAHEGVLVDLVLATGRSQRPPQLGELLDGESAVLGEEGSVGSGQLLADLVDHRDLLQLSGSPSSTPPFVAQGARRANAIEHEVPRSSPRLAGPKFGAPSPPGDGPEVYGESRLYGLGRTIVPAAGAFPSGRPSASAVRRLRVWCGWCRS